MLGSEEIMSILEGACPNDNASLQLILVGGTKEGLRWISYGQLKPTIWTGGDEVVGLEYKCPFCGHSFYVSQSKTGDWAGN